MSLSEQSAQDVLTKNIKRQQRNSDLRFGYHLKTIIKTLKFKNIIKNYENMF